jgi:hypothetical protein
LDRQAHGSCSDYLYDVTCYPDIINSYCLDLQRELVEILVDVVEFPEDREQTIRYLQCQQSLYHKRLETAKKRYNRFMFHLDKRTLSRQAREKSGYSSEIIRINLQFQDLKYKLASYLDGYEYDRNALYTWVIRLLQQNK